MTAEPRVAPVTGSASGIGLAIAQRLALAGYAIAMHSPNSPETGLQQAAALASHHLSMICECQRTPDTDRLGNITAG